MSYRWSSDTVFQALTLEVDDCICSHCGHSLKVCAHRQRRFFTFKGPVHLTSKLSHCADPVCPGHAYTISPEEETAMAMPRWVLGWDVFCWLGHRRFARHWSVPQIRADLADVHQIVLSPDAIERYIGRYQRMVAARQQDAAVLAQAYRGVKGLILSIDGLQPEKGHETLYVVREVGQKRVWFAEALISSSAAEVRRILIQARQWAERLGIAVLGWLSDKQDAFVSGIAAEFPDTPHRYCSNHFVRDLARPMLDADSHAKVQLRSKVRGLRAIEREVLDEQRQAEAVQVESSPPVSGASVETPSVVLDYCAAVRGILNDNQGGPLQPPSLNMAAALTEMQASIRKNLATKKRGARRLN